MNAQPHRRFCPPLPAAVAGTIMMMAGLAGVARAQSIGDLLTIAVPGFGVAPGVTAQSRLHQDDTPLGITLGGSAADLVMYPALEASLGGDSAPGVGRGASAVALAQPGLRIEDAALGLVGFANADLTRYAADPLANSNDVTAGLGLALPLGADTVTLGVARIATQETALGMAQQGGAAPFGVVVSDGRIALRLPFGMFDATERFEVSRAVLSQSAGGAPAAFHDQTTIRAASELATADDGVLRGLALLKLTVARYQGAVPGDGFANANAIALLGGIETEPSGILRLRVLAGLVHQGFAAATPASRTTPIGSIGLGWSPDGLISTELDITREAGLDSTLGTPGTAVTSATLALAVAFSRDIVLTASIDGRAGTIARHQADEIDTLASATWHWSRALALTPSLSYAVRHDLPGSAPREARVSLALVWTP
ncbi:outer membrane beta-barrel protein [Acidiphilium sp.]|uniref:outer membrane beta-barrel protein n=1 Tax=Acidiphilium sp. TaxID=527 RepID=UPI003CFDB8FE